MEEMGAWGRTRKGELRMEFEWVWLNYKTVKDREFDRYLTAVNYAYGDPVIMRAIDEIKLTVKAMYGHMIASYLRTDEELEECSGIILRRRSKRKLGNEGYSIVLTEHACVIEANASAGLLYGVFEVFRRLVTKKNIADLKCECIPKNPLRMLNHWDNIDGSIERGYSGNSFFFHHDQVLFDKRTLAYARLIASVGINAVVINNVNVRQNATKLITEQYLDTLSKIGEVFESYNIRLFLSINFAAPMELGGLLTADPLDNSVRKWWKEQAALVFDSIPSFGGFLVKADSEGRPGPFTYQRTHADGANMLAAAVKPYDGLIIWRCFVYNCQQDWRDTKTDRARAAYDNFVSLDGQFKDNVILQIKNGPMDFQVREPVSPIFGAMPKTNQMLELQITQEYTGQQKHVCYLLPMFAQVLGFHTYCQKEHDRVSDIVSGRTYGNTNCGIAAVANTGSDSNWTGHDLAAANLYGFGRISFDTELTPQQIAKEWIELTYSREDDIFWPIEKILMMSYEAYENYTAPLGIGWMVNPSHHYGPNPDGYEYDRWGTYHRADHLGIGVDRTTDGTGYVTQYKEPNSSMYNSLDTCPDELLLFFHHVPYTYRLHSGKTVIQHIYDSHFTGAKQAKEMEELWKSQKGKINPLIYERVAVRLAHQVWHAKEWCDVICSYFYRKSGIEDEQHRKVY